MSEITKVLEAPDKMTIFLVVVAAIVSVQFILKLYDYFRERLGLETKTTLEKKSIRQEIDSIKAETDAMQECQRQMLETQNKIIKTIEKMDQRELKNEVEHSRWIIIDFANALRSNRSYDREAFNHVLKTYTHYEQILKENGMENGEVDMAIDFIKKKYAFYLEKGFPYQY